MVLFMTELNLGYKVVDHNVYFSIPQAASKHETWTIHANSTNKTVLCSIKRMYATDY